MNIRKILNVRRADMVIDDSECISLLQIKVLMINQHLEENL